MATQKLPENQRSTPASSLNTETNMGTDDRVQTYKYDDEQGDGHPIDDKYNFHEASFRRHYQLRYNEAFNADDREGRPRQADDTRGFEFYEPAYRFGYELAAESPGIAWNAVEAEAQRHWRANHTGDWREVEEAIRYGWQEQRDPESLRVHHNDEYSALRTGFQAHHAEALSDSGFPFDDYEPAYRRGYDMAIDPVYRTHLWADVEPEVRKYYESEYAEGQMPWEHYHDAAYHAWRQVRGS